MVQALFVLFFIVFSALAWINFRLAIALLIVFLPTYLIRTSFFWLPTTLLEITFGAIFFVWLIRYSRKDISYLKDLFKNKRLICFSALILLLASFIAALANPYLLKALGIWRAYFLEPILLFFIISASRERLSDKMLSASLIISALSVALLTIWQKFSGTLYPPSLWDDALFGRPTSFFTSPNAIGLYLTPILLISTIYLEKIKKSYWFFYLVMIICLLAIILTFSQGSWIALGAGIVVYLFMINFKKTALGIVGAGIIIALFWPGLRQAILFQDQAGKNRLTIWAYSVEYLAESPRNFILGSGLRRFFTEVQKPNYNQAELERLIYPHNIFLNFWLETGLLGMTSFIVILISLFHYLGNNDVNDRFLRAALFSSLSAIIIHGLVDVPYFKNDLSMLFWIIAATIILASHNPSQKKLNY